MNIVTILATLTTLMLGYFEGIYKHLSTLVTRLNAHIRNTSNPHAVNKADVGLDAVQNYPLATQPQAESGANNNSYMTPTRTEQYMTKNLYTPVAEVFEKATSDLNNL